MFDTAFQRLQIKTVCAVAPQECKLGGSTALVLSRLQPPIGQPLQPAASFQIELLNASVKKIQPTRGQCEAEAPAIIRHTQSRHRKQDCLHCAASTLHSAEFGNELCALSLADQPPFPLHYPKRSGLSQAVAVEQAFSA